MAGACVRHTAFLCGFGFPPRCIFPHVSAPPSSFAANAVLTRSRCSRNPTCIALAMGTPRGRRHAPNTIHAPHPQRESKYARIIDSTLTPARSTLCKRTCSTSGHAVGHAGCQLTSRRLVGHKLHQPCRRFHACQAAEDQLVVSVCTTSSSGLRFWPVVNCNPPGA